MSDDDDFHCNGKIIIFLNLLAGIRGH